MPAGKRRQDDLGGQDVLRRAGDASVLILTSLADGPKHGYALIQDINGFAGLRLGPGTLYGALDRLERLGLVAALPTDERRHPYQITVAGAAALRAHLDALERVSAVGRLGCGWAGSDAGATARRPGRPRAALLPAAVAAAARRRSCRTGRAADQGRRTRPLHRVQLSVRRGPRVADAAAGTPAGRGGSRGAGHGRLARRPAGAAVRVGPGQRGQRRPGTPRQPRHMATLRPARAPAPGPAPAPRPAPAPGPAPAPAPGSAPAPGRAPGGWSWRALLTGPARLGPRGRCRAGTSR